jgi:uncharacterized protein GlcG (DUF336 family)
MPFMGKFLAIAMLSLAFTASAGAQAPQVEKNVSMKMALMIIEGALEQCTKDGYKVSVVVVDKAGNVAASVRGDGTNPHTVEFGRLKAYTARTRGQTSLEFKNLTDKPENAYLKQIPNVVAVGGGVPIKVGNEVIGAVGVSGAPGGEKDEACANAGIAKVAASLNRPELASRGPAARLPSEARRKSIGEQDRRGASDRDAGARAFGPRHRGLRASYGMRGTGLVQVIQGVNW